MYSQFDTPSIVIGILAAIGVVVLVACFVWVVRQVFHKEE
ncbi:MAG: hypothetical protein K0S45_3357 [Nitrospira sp.]|jgi:hypothetical protein|nr:hypothetical protein [Nitrospira sp.]